MARDLFEVGEAPPLGEVPDKMHAWVVRPERFGEPDDAFQREVIDVPEIADDEVLVYVMAAGVNYNNVWAARGVPVNVIAARNKQGEPEDFHIGGSDASGIVYKVGKDVKRLKVGDEVVVHCGTWSRDCPLVKAGVDPMYSPTFRIWGYETNYGSFAQFTRVQAHQCLPKPRHLSWEEAAAYMLVGATAYRMLLGWDEHALRQDDVVLVWGGAGGLGSMATQIARAVGAVPIAVVSSESKFEYCISLGAKGCVNRKEYDHWGMLPHWKDKVGYGEWLKGVRKFGKAVWDILGERKNPRIVFEHPGEATIPTSIFVCETGGMVVICAGTTGYNATVDLRYLWMRQKRLQGSHFANDQQAKGVNDLVRAGLVDPCLSQTFTFDELPLSHQLMYENKHPHGNMAILVGASDKGLGKIGERPVAHHPVPPPHAEEDRPPHTEPASSFISAPLESEESLVIPDKPTVRDMMHLGLVTCRVDATLTEAARCMVQNDIHALVVVDPSQEPVGVLSQTDLVLARQTDREVDFSAIRVDEVMTPKVITCDAETPLASAITTLTRLRIHRLVVTEKRRGKNVAIGILSTTDIVREMLAA